MSQEIAVLRALLRIARRRKHASLEEILLRVDAGAEQARRALVSLSRAGLVHDTATGPRLTLTGFAVAVAMTASVPRAKQRAPRPAPTARALPLLRRGRAA